MNRNIVFSGSIETGLVAYADPECESYEAFNEGSLGLIAFLLLFVLSLVTSNLSVFLVEERRSKFAHQVSSRMSVGFDLSREGLCF